MTTERLLFLKHQYPWYRGTGAKGEMVRSWTWLDPKRAAARLTPQVNRNGCLRLALEEISGKFKPDLIIISAGFDSHRGDPLGQLLLEDQDFISLTRTAKDWANQACNGRLVSCLEGGYNLETLGETVKAHVLELMHA